MAAAHEFCLTLAVWTGVHWKHSHMHSYFQQTTKLCWNDNIRLRAGKLCCAYLSSAFKQTMIYCSAHCLGSNIAAKAMLSMDLCSICLYQPSQKHAWPEHEGSLCFKLSCHCNNDLSRV